MKEQRGRRKEACSAKDFFGSLDFILTAMRSHQRVLSRE